MLCMLDDLCILVLFPMILEGYYRLSLYPDLKLHSSENIWLAMYLQKLILMKELIKKIFLKNFF